MLHLLVQLEAQALEEDVEAGAELLGNRCVYFYNYIILSNIVTMQLLLEPRPALSPHLPSMLQEPEWLRAAE
jgi:hypothetical protein